MESRIKNPLILLPEALSALLALDKATANDDVSLVTREFIRLRASQINNCSVCVDMHSRALKNAGEKDERIFAVASWRDTPYFTDAERAVLALTEAATRLSDREDAVSDEVWADATRHYNEGALATIVLQIAMINAFNRVNVSVRQIVPTGPK
jgi:AhpD family alkylhydroperoxidase